MTADAKFLLLGAALVSAVLLWPSAPCGSLLIAVGLIVLGFAAVRRRLH